MVIVTKYNSAIIKMPNDTNTHELGQEHWVTEILGEKQDLFKCLYGTW